MPGFMARRLPHFPPEDASGAGASCGVEAAFTGCAQYSL